jgi:uncharacterized membrane protein YgdD (TMEM256/DUF423 family)
MATLGSLVFSGAVYWLALEPIRLFVALICVLCAFVGAGVWLVLYEVFK